MSTDVSEEPTAYVIVADTPSYRHKILIRNVGTRLIGHMCHIFANSSLPVSSLNIS
jgi:hypothetical protein